MNTLQDIQQRIACNDLETRLEALREALNHGQAGLKLVRANLNDKQIGQAAHSIIWEWQEKQFRQKLKPNSATLISELESILFQPKSLRYTIHDDGWESNCGFVPFIWEYDRLGEYKPSQLFSLTQWNIPDFLERGIKEGIVQWAQNFYLTMEDLSYLKQETLDKQSTKFTNDTQKLVDFLRSNLDCLYVSRLTLTAPETEEYKPGEVNSIRGVTTYVRPAVFVGRIPQGDWLAITCKYRGHWYIKKLAQSKNLQAEFKQTLHTNIQTFNFIKQLEDILQGMSSAGKVIRDSKNKSSFFDTDYVYAVANNRNSAVDKLLKIARLIVIEEFDDFKYRSDSGYRRLSKFLRKHLMNVRYQILFDTYLYILDNINTKDLLGVVTRVW